MAENKVESKIVPSFGESFLPAFRVVGESTPNRPTRSNLNNVETAERLNVPTVSEPTPKAPPGRGRSSKGKKKD